MRLRSGLFLCWIAAAAAQGPAPARTATLRSPQLEVLLDRDAGLPYEYRLLSNQAVIHGAEPGHGITATVFRAQPHEFRAAGLKPRGARATATRADFFFTAQWDGRPATSFTLRYELGGAAVFVSLEDIEEKPGFQLIDVGTPDLATVREEDGGGWLAHGETGGNLIQLSAARPGHLPPNRFWFGVAATLPVVMIGTSKALCVQEVMAFMDTTELAVEGEPGHRRAELGTSGVHRVNGSLAWDMNADPGKPRVAGNDGTPNLLVEQRPLARLDFAGDYDHDGAVDWLDGAKIVRARMPPIPTHYYDDRLPYMVHVDEPRWPAPRMTFDETGNLVRQVAMLTAYAPQDVYLWGWQFRGKDTGYPAVSQVNARAGGYQGLRKLIADGRTVNANVSFADNYDDAYKSSPAWDPSYIAREPNGELWESRNWTGENSYILGLAKYMAGLGTDRVRYTCKQYPVRDTYLIDVLSYYPIRNDWDPANPASGIRNLTEGRYKVLDEFKKCGLDIVSEQLRYAFVGKNSVNDNGPAGGPSPFGGEPIPLAATIYRRSAIWGLSGQAWRKAPEIYSLFYNGHEFFGGPETPEHLAAFYYGMMVPWYQVHYRDVESYRRDGDRTVIGLAGNSSIDIDWKNSRYTVTANGAEIAKDGDTFCPVGSDRIAFYSRDGGRLSAPLPAGWNAQAIAALALYSDHAEEVPVSKAGGKLTVEAPANRPIMVFRDGAAARKKMEVER
jgi:Endo-alpha-N-acetylgalactosaminidase